MPVFISETVDIYTKPASDRSHSAKGSEITLGDLHGNAMKLLFMLIKHTVVSKISNSDYQTLVTIYQVTPSMLTPNHLNTFNNIIQKMQCRTDVAIRLIGDDLADRGSNDYFTLKILQRLRLQRVPMEILLSNHNMEFITAYETYPTNQHFQPPMMIEFTSSLLHLDYIVSQNLVSRDEVLDIAQTTYGPLLKVVSYTIDDSRKEMMLFSHAGIGLADIEPLARRLNIPYAVDTTTNLAKTIDAINSEFQNHVQLKTVHTLFSKTQAQNAYIEGITKPAKIDPFVFIMWNRQSSYDRVFNIKGSDGSDYFVNYVHGHDIKDSTQKFIFNLDNKLGKTFKQNHGEYTALYSLQTQITFSVTKTNTNTPQTQKQGALAIATHNPQPSVTPEIEQQNSPAAAKTSSPAIVTPIIKPSVPLAALQQQFKQQLADLSCKALSLRKMGHAEAADKADELHEALQREFNLLCTHQNVVNFKHNCTIAIQKARQLLEQQRGWKKFLLRLLNTLRLNHVYKAITGRHLFFKTKSHKLLDKIEQELAEFTLCTGQKNQCS